MKFDNKLLEILKRKRQTQCN